MDLCIYSICIRELIPVLSLILCGVGMAAVANREKIKTFLHVVEAQEGADIDSGGAWQGKIIEMERKFRFVSGYLQTLYLLY